MDILIYLYCNAATTAAAVQSLFIQTHSTVQIIDGRVYFFLSLLQTIKSARLLGTVTHFVPPVVALFSAKTNSRNGIIRARERAVEILLPRDVGEVQHRHHRACMQANNDATVARRDGG